MKKYLYTTIFLIFNTVLGFAQWTTNTSLNLEVAGLNSSGNFAWTGNRVELSSTTTGGARAKGMYILKICGDNIGIVTAKWLKE